MTNRIIGLNIGYGERRRCLVCGGFWRLDTMRQYARVLWSCLDQGRCERYRRGAI